MDDATRTTTEGSTTNEFSLADPETLRGEDGTEFHEAESVEGEAHFENHEQWDGIAIVGVTDDDGDLLLLRQGENGRLPHGPVYPGEDYAETARNAVDEGVGVPVTVDEVACVRHLRYRHVDDPDRRTTGYQVVFAASPTDASGESPAVDAEGWTAEWTDEPPENPDWTSETVLEDVRRFLR